MAALTECTKYIGAEKTSKILDEQIKRYIEAHGQIRVPGGPLFAPPPSSPLDLPQGDPLQGALNDLMNLAESTVGGFCVTVVFAYQASGMGLLQNLGTNVSSTMTITGVYGLCAALYPHLPAQVNNRLKELTGTDSGTGTGTADPDCDAEPELCEPTIEDEFKDVRRGQEGRRCGGASAGRNLFFRYAVEYTQFVSQDGSVGYVGKTAKGQTIRYYPKSTSGGEPTVEFSRKKIRFEDC